MGELSQAITRDLADEMAASLDIIGGEMVADIRNDISVPVQYVGSKIIRSKPGESPRKEKGNLWRNVQMEMTRDGSQVVSMEVFCTLAYGKYLELGTEKIARRPWWETAWLRWRDRVVTFVNRPSR